MAENPVADLVPYCKKAVKIITQKSGISVAHVNAYYKTAIEREIDAEVYNDASGAGLIKSGYPPIVV